MRLCDRHIGYDPRICINKTHLVQNSIVICRASNLKKISGSRPYLAVKGRQGIARTTDYLYATLDLEF